MSSEVNVSLLRALVLTQPVTQNAEANSVLGGCEEIANLMKLHSLIHYLTRRSVRDECDNPFLWAFGSDNVNEKCNLQCIEYYVMRELENLDCKYKVEIMKPETNYKELIKKII